MSYDDALVEAIVMDLAGIIHEIECAFRNNPCAVKENIVHLKDSKAALAYIVAKIMKGAA